MLAICLAAIPVLSGCHSRMVPRPDAGTDSTERPRASATTPATAPRSSVVDRPLVIAKPSPVQPISESYLDSSGGRIYASFSGQLRIYDTTHGHLLAAERLEPEEILLGLDAAHQRLYVWSWSSHILRVLASDDRRELDRMPLAAMRPRQYTEGYSHRMSNTGQPRDWPSERPLLRRATGEILVIDDTWLRAYVPEEGKAHLAWSVDLGDRVKGLWGVYLADDGRTLYLQRREADLMDPEPTPPGEILALALPSGRDIGRIVGGAEFAVWGWGDMVFASERTYKWPIVHTLRIGDGRLLRRIASLSSYDSSILDSRRRRLIQRLTTEEVALWDADTLEISHVSPWPWQGSPVLYDPATDQVFIPAAEWRGLQVMPAAALEAVVAPAPYALDGSAIDLVGFPQLDGGRIDPAIRLGRRRSAAPTPIPNYPDSSNGSADAISRDGGVTWTRVLPGGLSRWPDTMLASANFVEDQTLYAHPHVMGVWRSKDAGRSWQPASNGLDVMSLRALHLAPQTTGELFAEAEFGDPMAEHPGLWRSRDGGNSWKELAGYHSLSFAPDYPRSRMILGFRGPRAYVSRDGGDSWERRGRMPSVEHDGWGVVGSSSMMLAGRASNPLMLAIVTTYSQAGGGLHWPESGQRLMSSTDGGWTWDVSWLPQQENLVQAQIYGWDGRLVGPVIDEAKAEMERWYLVVAQRVTLEIDLYQRADEPAVEDDDRPVFAKWVSLPGRPRAVPVAAAGPGRLMCYDEDRHEAFEVAAEAFNYVSSTPR